MRTPTKFAALAAGIFLLGSAIAPQETPPPSTTPPPKAETNKAMGWKEFDYVCDSGANLKLYLREDTAKVVYKDKMYLMKQTVSADGNRYSDGKVVWWGKGKGGFLQEDAPDGNGAMLAKDCKQVQPEPVNPFTVTGTVTYLQRIALPPTAVIEVKLQDVSKADAPATVIAEQKITAEDKQVPIPFALRYDPAQIDPKHRYTVSARIMVDGQLRFISDAAYPVLGSGAPATGVEIVVKAVPAKP